MNVSMPRRNIALFTVLTLLGADPACASQSSPNDVTASVRGESTSCGGYDEFKIYILNHNVYGTAGEGRAMGFKIPADGRNHIVTDMRRYDGVAVPIRMNGVAQLRNGVLTYSSSDQYQGIWPGTNESLSDQGTEAFQMSIDQNAGTCSVNYHETVRRVEKGSQVLKNAQCAVQQPVSCTLTKGRHF